MTSAPILVATDLSARADRAIDRAMMLGQQLVCEVVVVHARKFSTRESEVDVEGLVREVLPQPQADVRMLFPLGTPPEEIAQAAIDIGAAILCVGPARYNAIGDYFLGNAVDHIARFNDAPLLVVKKRAHNHYEKIVFATDFSDCSRDALVIAAKLFPKTEIRLVHAYQVPFQSWQKAPYVREEVQNWAQSSMDEFVEAMTTVPELAGRFSGAIVCGSAFDAVSSELRNGVSTLAAFGTHGESGFRHATIGSVANQLLDTLPIDSLMIKVPQH